MAAYMVKKVVQRMIKNGIDIANSTVGVMGITFKENCPDVRNSKIIDVVSELKNWGTKVVVVDTWADPLEVERTYGISLGEISADQQVDSLIVAVSHDEFRNLSPEMLRSFCRGSQPILADVKSIYERTALIDFGFSVFRL
jgi:UDP-N-acetyl-D-galactosamine dehydrogenase